MFVDGEFIDAAGPLRDILDPATAGVIAQVADANPDDVARAIAAARRAFDSQGWPRTPGRQRARILYALAERLRERAEELAALETLNSGKPIAEAEEDIEEAAACFEYYAGLATKLTGDALPVPADALMLTLKEPVGVAAQIIPWNFPLIMATLKISPALAVGCTVILKPAEQTSLTALRLADLVVEAGFPPGVVNVITGNGHTAGDRLVRHPGVDKIAFTGSTEVGKIINRTATDTLKRVSLELGGKSPNIVFADADMDKAIEGAHFALFFNQGQCCCAGSRLFVEEKAYDQFVEKSVERAKKRTVGNPFDKNTEQGPQVDQDQFNKVMNYIDIGKKEKAKLMAGGGRVGDKGYFIEPTVFADVQDDMKIAQEEIFGPVMSILKFKDINEVVERANKSLYGLAAAVWTSDITKAHAIADGVRAGTVWVNCYDVFDAAAPFGGFKQSGIGRELGEYGLANYTEVKTVTVKL